MKKTIYNNAGRGHVLIMALGITMLTILILASLAGARPFADIQTQAATITLF
jgi:hypothetical protein